MLRATKPDASLDFVETEQVEKGATANDEEGTGQVHEELICELNICIVSEFSLAIFLRN